MLNLLLSLFVLWKELDLKIKRVGEDKQNSMLIDVIYSCIVNASAPAVHQH